MYCYVASTGVPDEFLLILCVLLALVLVRCKYGTVVAE